MDIQQPRERLIVGLSASVASQMLTSLANMLVGLVLIRASSKSEYALYSQLLAIVQFTNAVQGSLINLPALALLPRLTAERRAEVAGSLLLFQTVLSGIAAGLTIAAAFLILPQTAMSGRFVLLMSGTTAALLISWIRDYLRNQLFLEFKTVACLRSDLIFVVVLAAGILLAVASHRLDAASILFALASAGTVAAVAMIPAARLRLRWSTSALRETWLSGGSMMLWSLPAGVVAWAYGSGYVLVAARVVGEAAIAEILAARLLTAPLGMIFTAAANVFRPRVVVWFAQGRRDFILRYLLVSALAIGVMVVGWTAAVWLSYPFLEHHVLSSAYSGLQTDALLWGVFFVGSGIAGVGTGTLSALGKFRPVFWSSVFARSLSVPAMIWLGRGYGKAGILVALASGEALTAAWQLGSVWQIAAAKPTQGHRSTLVTGNASACE